MKFFATSVLLIASLCLQAQPDSLSLLFQWDNPAIEASYDGDNRYNEVFGFVVKGEEYAVLP